MPGTVAEEAPWIELHGEVWLLTPGSSPERDHVEKVKVVKVNKREVWVRTARSTEHKFTPVSGTGKMYQQPRRTGGFHPRNQELLPLDDPRVDPLISRQRQAGKLVLAQRAFREFEKEPSLDAVTKIINRLEDYVKEITDGKL